MELNDHRKQSTPFHRKNPVNTSSSKNHFHYFNPVLENDSEHLKQKLLRVSHLPLNLRVIDVG